MKTTSMKLLLLVTVPILMTSSKSSGAFKLGEYDLDTSVTIGVQAESDNHRSAKFVEYRDRKDGLLASGALSAAGGGYHLGLSFNRVGLDDQSYTLSGGSWGTFKYQLFFDEMPHNYSFGNLFLYDPATVGTTTLSHSYTAANLANNAVNWPTRGFDLGIERKNYGAEIDYLLAEPFSAKLGFNQVKTKGTMPIGYSFGFTWADVPMPIDWTTNNFTTNLGYHSGDLHLELDGILSTYDNANEVLNVQKPTLTSTTTFEKYTLAPDNKLWKVGANLGWKGLPMDSTLTSRVSYTKITNEVPLLTKTGLGTSGMPGTEVDLAPYMSATTFSGKYWYGSAGAALVSEPIEHLDTKLYYNFLKKGNNSTEIALTGTNARTNHRFHYLKHDAGMDADFRLPMATKLGAGYEYMKVERNREDAEETKDHIVYLEAKNSALDMVTAKLRYQKLWRTSHFALGDAGATSTSTGTGAGTDKNYIFRSVRLFDVTDKNQDRASLSLDLAPFEHLDFGVEAAYKGNKYTQTVLGRNKDFGYELLGDLSYEMPRWFKANLFANYNRTTALTSSRNMSSAAGTSFDPASASTTAAYNWNYEILSRELSYGLDLTLPLIEKKLDFLVGWQQDYANGDVSFSADHGSIIINNIPAWDDYKRQTVKAVAQYQIMDNLSASVAYQYEKWNLSDVSWNGYNYNATGVTSAGVASASTSQYLSGAYADNRQYKAHLGVVSATYTF